MNVDLGNGAQRPKPRVELIGRDGNAYAILGRALKALRDAGWTKDECDAFLAEATRGDYDHLLGAVMKYLEVG